MLLFSLFLDKRKQLSYFSKHAWKKVFVLRTSWIRQNEATERKWKQAQNGTVLYPTIILTETIEYDAFSRFILRESDFRKFYPRRVMSKCLYIGAETYLRMLHVLTLALPRPGLSEPLARVRLDPVAGLGIARVNTKLLHFLLTSTAHTHWSGQKEMCCEKRGK